MSGLFNIISGIMVVIILAGLSYLGSEYFAFSTTVMALLVGFLVSNLITVPEKMTAGIQWVECHGLAAAVALLGLQLQWSILMQINTFSLGLITFSLLLTFFITWALARLFNIDSKTSCLVASGQGICGSAAVLATAKVIKPSDQTSTGLIIAVINFLGFLGVFISVWLAQFFFNANDQTSGLLIGNTLQSMGHVVAAGFSVNDSVGHGAVLIKMCRILLLVPTLIVMIVLFKKTKYSAQAGAGIQSRDSAVKWFQLVPWFIWAFVALMLLNNMVAIPADIQQGLNQVSDALFVLAMVAIGLSIRMRHIWHHGIKLLLLASLVFVLQMAMTFSLLSLF